MRLTGFEPAALSAGDSRSIQLSYRRVSSWPESNRRRRDPKSRGLPGCPTARKLHQRSLLAAHPRSLLRVLLRARDPTHRSCCYRTTRSTHDRVHGSDCSSLQNNIAVKAHPVHSRTIFTELFLSVDIPPRITNAAVREATFSCVLMLPTFAEQAATTTALRTTSLVMHLLRSVTWLPRCFVHFVWMTMRRRWNRWCLLSRRRILPRNYFGNFSSRHRSPYFGLEGAFLIMSGLLCVGLGGAGRGPTFFVTVLVFLAIVTPCTGGKKNCMAPTGIEPALTL